MATEGSRYYWIKLRDDFFDLDIIDWLKSQKNGCEYIVLYQQLCLLTANKKGEMFSMVGEMIIPFDVNKIAKDTKTEIDTVIVALELFKRIGLIYEQENGILKIPAVEEMVGSETKWAEKKRRQRELGGQTGDNVPQNVPDNVREDIDKDIDIYINYNDDEKEKINDDDEEERPRELVDNVDKYKNWLEKFASQILRALGHTRRPTRYELKTLEQWFNWGFSVDMIEFVLPRTVGASNPSFSYISAILNDLRFNQVFTIEEGKAYYANPNRTMLKGGMLQ